jgi:signal transduction histidine kinase
VFGDPPNMIGGDFDELIHALWPNPYADFLIAKFRATLATGEPYVHAVHSERRLDRDQTEHYEWQIMRTPLPEGRHGVVCYFRDVSARARTIQELDLQREELQTMLNLIPAGVAIAHDPLCKHISASPRLARMLRMEADRNASLSSADGPGNLFQCIRDGKVIPAEELPMQLAARTGTDQLDVEFDVQFSNGETTNVMVSAAPLFDAQGRVRGCIAAHVDVSAFKQAQRKLETADQQKDEFLAMLAHELRNPLAPLRHASELLTRISPDARIQRSAHVIQRQVTQLARLVDDLLDVSRITRGQIVLKAAPVDVASLVALAIEAVDPLIREKRHQLSVTYADAPIVINADATRLVQCIVNLLTNAAKYTDEGGAISIRLSGDGSRCRIAIQDNGIGISTELLPRIFDLFVQNERTLDRSQGGLGVGLSLVRRLIELHGGDVIASSEGIGRGSTFYILLPITVHSFSLPAALQPIKSGARRVMIVDDNRDAAESLALVLSLDGHYMHAVFTAKDALNDAQAFRPDVILLDIGLPEMDGYEVARSLRGLAGLERLRIIAVTGYGQSEDLQRTKAAGFDGHLVKPVDIGAIAHAIAGEP